VAELGTETKSVNLQASNEADNPKQDLQVLTFVKQSSSVTPDSVTILENRTVTAQEIPLPLWNPKFHHRVHNSLHLNQSTFSHPVNDQIPFTIILLSHDLLLH
jgi:hypothetical protein